MQSCKGLVVDDSKSIRSISSRTPPFTRDGIAVGKLRPMGLK
jgi:hypothetical protein